MHSSFKAAPLLGLAALAALGLVGAHPAQAQIVQDGSFEKQAVPSNPGYTTINTPSPLGSGSPWTVASGSVDLISTYWQAEDGLQSVDLSGNTGGSIYQDLTTTVGTTYNLSYYLAGNPDGAPTVKTLGVSAGTTIFTPVSFDTTGKTKAAMGWTLETASFTATTATTRLQFTSLNTPDNTSPYGPALDNVQVTVAPEPSSITAFAFLGLGMLGLALKARKGRATA